MTPNTSIICQAGGHTVAIQYARLVADAQLPVLVNFPSQDGFPIATTAEQLINSRTGAVILVVSPDLFPGEAKSPHTRIDTEVIHALLSASMTTARSRLFLVLTDGDAEAKIKGTWLNDLQWERDSSIKREQILENVRRAASRGELGEEISSFTKAASIISAIEPSSLVDRIAAEKIPADRVSYEIFKCTHRFREDEQYYIHLHRGITITNTAKHLRANHPDIFWARNKLIVMGIERGHVRPQERLANVEVAFEGAKTRYLEDIVSAIVAESVETSALSRAHLAARKFVEPQVRKGLGGGGPPAGYASVVDWLGSSRSGVLVLVGQGGIGKTWAMMNLRQRVTSGKLSFAKPVKRTVIFISATDVVRSYGRALVDIQDITLYDLYCASIESGGGTKPRPKIDRETFYNALELGNLVVFVDGLDEVITRHRGRFNPSTFFGDLSDRMVGDSEGKVVVSCRNIFFDQDEFRLSFPYIETFELLPFDSTRRDRLFLDGLSAMPGRFAKAAELSNKIGRLNDGGYVPFVLELIKEIILEQADTSLDQGVDKFQSEFLDPTILNDRVVGQFCHREMVKTVDPSSQLSVDEQVDVFCRMARSLESLNGRLDVKALTSIMEKSLRKKGVDEFVQHFVTHPFVSQEEFARRKLVDFRFDFMPEYFLTVDAYRRMEAAQPVDATDIRIFGKYSSLTSPFCQGIIQRISYDATDLRLRLVHMNEQAWELIATSDEFLDEDRNILLPDSALANYSFTLVSLLAAFEGRHGSINTEGFTNGLLEVFGVGRTLLRAAFLDGFVKEDERLRIDFRGLSIEECLFHGFDIWNCEFDSETVFSKCRFINCTGVYSRSSGVHEATFQSDCLVDAEFEKIYASGHKKIRSGEAQNLEAIRSFVADFYKHGGFRPIGSDRLERFYGHSNSVVPFKTIYRYMLRHGIVEEKDKGHYTEVRIKRAASEAAERLVTQGVLSGALEAVAVDLR